MEYRGSAPPSTELVAIMLLLTVASASIVAAMQPNETIHTSGVVNSSTTGSIYFEDSFEDEAPRIFGWNYSYPPRAPPIDWGPDISDEWGAYVKVVSDSTAAYDGNVGLYFYCPKKTVSTVFDYIFVRLGYNQIKDVFYVSWYQKFETLPTIYDRYVSVFVMTSRTGTVYSAQTAQVNIAKNSVSLSKMYKDGSGIFSNGTTFNFDLSRWYHFEVLYKYGITDGEYKLWVDNKVVVSSTGINTTPVKGLDYRPAGFEIGIIGTDYGDCSSWVDDVLAADYPVGHEKSTYVYQTSFEFADQYSVEGAYGGHVQIASSPEPVRKGIRSLHEWGLKDFYVTTNTPITILGSFNYTFTNGTRVEVIDKQWYDGKPYYNITVAKAESLGLYDWYYEQANKVSKVIAIDNTWQWEYIFFTVRTTDSNGNPSSYYFRETYPRGRVGPKDYNTIGSFSELYMRIYIYYKRLDASHTILRFYGFSTQGEGAYIMMTAVSLGAVTMSLGMQKGATSDWVPYDINRNPVREVRNNAHVNLNQWHCIEQYFKKSNPGEYNGGGKVWLDGVEVLSRMDLDTSAAPNISTIVTGLVLTNDPLDFYIDEWAVSTSYIGP